MEKIFNGIISIIHLIMAFVLLLASQLISQLIIAFIVRKIFPNEIVLTITASVLYLIIAIFLCILYSKITIHASAEEIGMIKKFPELRWIILSLALPLIVTAFFLIFMNGEIIKGSYRTALVFTDSVLSSAIAGINEEIIFRGMLMTAFMKKWNKEIAVIIPSILFAAIHIIMLHSFEITSILMLLIGGTLVGIMFSLAVIKSRSIWSSVVLHMFWNIIMIGGIFVIEAPDCGMADLFLYKYVLSSNNLLISGGTFGVECSLPSMIAFICVSVLILFMPTKQDYKTRLFK